MVIDEDHHPPVGENRKRKRAPPPPPPSSSPGQIFRLFSPLPPVPGPGNPKLGPPTGVILSWLLPMMETEMQHMEGLPAGSRKRAGEIIEEAIEYNNGGRSPGYTSLRDIIPTSPCAAGSLLLPLDHCGNGGFSSANITIKNQLVKHAASMYLQSTAMLANRNRSCFPRIWTRAAVRRRKPAACICLGAITRPICSFLHDVANQIAGFWGGRNILV